MTIIVDNFPITDVIWVMELLIDFVNIFLTSVTFTIWNGIYTSTFKYTLIKNWGVLSFSSEVWLTMKLYLL